MGKQIAGMTFAAAPLFHENSRIDIARGRGDYGAVDLDSETPFGKLLDDNTGRSVVLLDGHDFDPVEEPDECRLSRAWLEEHAAMGHVLQPWRITVWWPGEASEAILCLGHTVTGCLWNMAAALARVEFNQHDQPTGNYVHAVTEIALARDWRVEHAQLSNEQPGRVKWVAHRSPTADELRARALKLSAERYPLWMSWRKNSLAFEDYVEFVMPHRQCEYEIVRQRSNGPSRLENLA